MTLTDAGAPDVLDAQIAYHLHVGVDVVIVPASIAIGPVREVLDAYARPGHLHVADVGEPRTSARALLARLAVADHHADWIIDARPGEFWWPRERNLHRVLAPVPPRYGVVQGLVRQFVVRSEDGGPFWKSTTLRSSLLPEGARSVSARESAVRPVYRAHPDLDPSVDGGGPGTRQPLRSWYPIEVLTVPGSGVSPTQDEVSARLESGSLVIDDRLCTALDALHGGEGFAVSTGDQDNPWLPIPTVVDDASYAVECAAVGEVDLARLDEHIRELESRITWLEDRIGPRVLRTVSRLVRRASR